MLRAVSDPYSALAGRLRFEPGEGLAGWVAEHNQAVFIPENAPDDPRAKVVPGGRGGEVPVAVRGAAAGQGRPRDRRDRAACPGPPRVHPGGLRLPRPRRDAGGRCHRERAALRGHPAAAVDGGRAVRPGPGAVGGVHPGEPAAGRRPARPAAARGVVLRRAGGRCRRPHADPRRGLAGAAARPAVAERERARRGAGVVGPRRRRRVQPPAGRCAVGRRLGFGRGGADGGRRGAGRRPGAALCRRPSHRRRAARDRHVGRKPGGGRDQEGAADRPADGAKRDQGPPRGPVARERDGRSSWRSGRRRSAAIWRCRTWCCRRFRGRGRRRPAGSRSPSRSSRRRRGHSRGRCSTGATRRCAG